MSEVVKGSFHYPQLIAKRYISWRLLTTINDLATKTSWEQDLLRLISRPRWKNWKDVKNNTNQIFYKSGLNRD